MLHLQFCLHNCLVLNPAPLLLSNADLCESACISQNPKAAQRLSLLGQRTPAWITHFHAGYAAMGFPHADLTLQKYKR